MCNFFYVLETQHHFLVWLTRYHILDRNHCCENCSPFPKPQNNLTIFFFYSKKKWKHWYFSLISEVSKICCRLLTVWGSTTMCLDGGALSSCECRRVVAVLTVKENPRRVVKLFSSESSWKPKTQPNNSRAAVWLSFWFLTRPSADAVTY